MVDFNYNFVTDKIVEHINESNAKVEEFMIQMKQEMRETYESKEEFEKELFISDLNSAINVTQTSEHKTWSNEGSSDKKNAHDYLLEFERYIVALSNHHNSTSRNTDTTSQKPINLMEDKLNIRIVYLQELGILDFLREKYKIQDINKLASIISSFSGIESTTVQPCINPMINEGNNQKNNPCTPTNTQKVRDKLINIGIKLE